MSRIRWAAFPVVLAALAACESGPIGPESDLRPQFAVGDLISGTPAVELLKVCKDASSPAGLYTFNVTYSGSPASSVASVQLNPGECRHLAVASTPVTATIVEVPAGGAQFASASVAYAGDNVTAHSINAATATVIVTFGEDPTGPGVNPAPSGATVTYVNEPIPVVGDEGCTPGYWKNHTDSWAATGYATGQTLESVFDVPDGLGLDNATLLEALGFGGGPGALGGAKILLRAAVAGLLNAAHPGVDYVTDTATLIADVNAALASGNRATMLALADQIDTDNNAGCPLN